jgi:hypothetical protein
MTVAELKEVMQEVTVRSQGSAFPFFQVHDSEFNLEGTMAPVQGSQPLMRVFLPNEEDEGPPPEPGMVAKLFQKVFKPKQPTHEELIAQAQLDNANDYLIKLEDVEIETDLDLPIHYIGDLGPTRLKILTVNNVFFPQQVLAEVHEFLEV